MFSSVCRLPVHTSARFLELRRCLTVFTYSKLPNAGGFQRACQSFCGLSTVLRRHYCPGYRPLAVNNIRGIECRLLNSACFVGDRPPHQLFLKWVASSAFSKQSVRSLHVSVRRLSSVLKPSLSFERDSLLSKYLDNLLEKCNTIQREVAALLASLNQPCADAESADNIPMKIEQLNRKLTEMKPIVALISQHRAHLDEIEELRNIIKGNFLKA